MPEGIGLIIEDYNHTLLLHLRDEHAPSLKNEWCLIGGSVESGETLETAALRELKEEINLSSQEVISFFTTFIKEDTQKTIHIFHVIVDTRQQQMILGEGKDLKFMTKDEILKLISGITKPNQYLLALRQFIEK